MGFYNENASLKEQSSQKRTAPSSIFVLSFRLGGMPYTVVKSASVQIVQHYSHPA